MKKIIDSNILIYSYKDFIQLRGIFRDTSVYLSEISKMETLGFHQLKQDEKQYFVHIFEKNNIITIDSEIIDRAIELKQKQKMSIGDAIIAATALIYDLEIITRNTKDFEKIKGLKATNPLI